MEQTEIKPKKRQLVGMVILLLFLIALVSGFTYAIYELNKLGDQENTITTGTLDMIVNDSTATELNLVGLSPISDEEGLAQLEQNPYTFTIKNNGTLTAKYRLRLVKDAADYPNGVESARSQYIKYAFKSGTQVTVGHIDDNGGVLVTDKVLSKDGSETFSITLWIDNEEDIPSEQFDTTDIQFHGHVQVEAIQDGHTNYTTGE